MTVITREKDKNMETYWNERAETYSELNLAQMENGKRHMWEEMILRHAPQKQTLKILDIGTGPGFFAMILALKGHQVIAADYSSSMLEQAKINAIHYQAQVDFVHLTADRLPFADESFDLVVSRDVTWSLREPEKTLQEWQRVTRRGGKVLYFDANWYYYLFNDQAMEEHRQNQIRMRQHGMGVIYRKVRQMEGNARALPLSRQARPHWDLQTLPQLGFAKVNAITGFNELLYTEEECIRYASKPEFLVVAER